MRALTKPVLVLTSDLSLPPLPPTAMVLAEPVPAVMGLLQHSVVLQQQYGVQKAVLAAEISMHGTVDAFFNTVAYYQHIHSACMAK
jgi:hypothetical protein